MKRAAIHLRRPPVLQMLDHPYVPAGDAAVLDEVTLRWDALCVANPAYYDGRLCHVIGVHRNGYGGAVMHVADCAYRYFAVQDDDFDLGVRPLGVKGITRRADGRVLLGRRSARVAGYPGRWELAPGGVVEPGEHPAITVVKELREETGLACGEPTAIAVLYDDVVRTWEIVYRLTPADERAAASDEYDEVAWCAPEEITVDLTPIARSMVALL
ncbi:MAG: NUDIX domain-containing protein [Planctomycetes bacterium]|nr:NUDIX domain-containing protein [Planctomycetota bacterium]